MQKLFRIVLTVIVVTTVLGALRDIGQQGMTSLDDTLKSGDIRGAIGKSFNNAVLPLRLMQLQIQKAEMELLIPVDGVLVDHVTDTWGAPRSGGRKHEGQDIFAERGTPIRPVVAGYVTRVANRGLGGKQVYVTGAGGRQYYYAHLDDFADISYGDKVTTDTILGFVGNTGNAISTPPHLHFGVYTSSGAINPMPMFIDRE